EDQLRAFIEAAHILGKAVGYDIEAQQAQFSTAALMQPELFRWIKVDPHNRQKLDYGLSAQEIVQEENQIRIVAEVRTLVRHYLQHYQLETLELVYPKNSEQINHQVSIIRHITEALIEQGYWQIPNQVWDGVGLPGFRGYNVEGDYPE